MEEQGPFDQVLQPEPPSERPDRTATFIVGASLLLGLILLILVLPPISILDDGDDPSAAGPVGAVARDELPPLPRGYAAVSDFFDFAAASPVGSPRLTLPLSDRLAEGTALAFFSYQDDEWRKVGDAVAVGGGTIAQGEVSLLPPNLAVLRAVEQARVVLGSLPPGAALDERAASVLTALNPLGLAPAADGGIAGNVAELPPGLDLDIAPTVSAVTPNEAAALATILASPELRAAHVQALGALVRDNSYAGIGLDYRAIDPERSGEFLSFITDLSNTLRGEQRTLTITLPLPVRDGDAWNTLGFDWAALAPLVDTVKLAPEPEQDRYFARTEEALGYLVPRVGGEKLLLAISPLSRERSVDGVRALTLTEALAVASAPALETPGAVAPEATVRALGQNLTQEAGGSGLLWNDTARAVAFDYTGLGGQRTVWLANGFSEAFKLDLARRYQLGGVAIEDVSPAASESNVWPGIERFAQSGEVELVKPNGDLLQPRWTATGGALEPDAGAQVTWRAPVEAGTYALTLIVSDGYVRVGQQLQLEVESPSAVSP